MRFASTTQRYVVSPRCGDRGCRRCVVVDARAPPGEPVPVEQGGAVGALVQHRRAGRTGGHGRFDEEMGPPSDRSGPPVDRAPRRSSCGREREVALAVRRHSPQMVAPHLDAERFDPIRLGRCEVGGAVPTRAEREQPLAELTSVETSATLRRDGAQRSAERRDDARPRRDELACETSSCSASRAALVEARERADKERRSREAAFGEPDRRSEELRQRKRAEAGMERDPAVDAARHGDCADVMAERHRGVAFGPQAPRRPRRNRLGRRS